MSLLTMMTTSEKAIQKSMTGPRRSVHQSSFVWALCQEFARSRTQRFVAYSVECDKLLPEGLDDVWWERGHGQTLLCQ